VSDRVTSTAMLDRFRHVLAYAHNGARVAGDMDQNHPAPKENDAQARSPRSYKHCG